MCQYIDKKFTGDLAKIEYEDKGRAPVFRVSSLGIGRKFLEDNKEQLVHMGYCTVGGRVHSFPRYYLDKLGIDPEEYRQEAKYLAAESYEAVTGLNLDPDIAYRVRPAAEVAAYEVAARQTRAKEDRRRGQSQTQTPQVVIVLTYRSIGSPIDPASGAR